MKSFILPTAILSSALGGLSVGAAFQSPQPTPEAEAREILKYFSIVDLDDGQGGLVRTIRISGANLQIVNGLGATNGNPHDPFSTQVGTTAVNGAGNLILGYNEPRAAGPVDRTGSHYIVVGPGHAFSGFGGVVVGSANDSTAPYAPVYSGVRNRSTALGACITGGQFNLASGSFASVTGGFGSEAIGELASVSGGIRCQAAGPFASVSGGYKSRATGDAASVSGGDRCEAQGTRASVSGGSVRIAAGDEDWAAGSLLEDQ